MLFNAGLAKRVKAVLAQTYDSLVTISRLVDQDDGNGTIQTRPVLAKNVPCRRSKHGMSALHPTTGEATITFSEMLFCGPAVDILEGDELLVTGPLGAVNPGPDRYFAGKIARYTTHQEVRLEFVGRA
ncbi:MAG: hypothetical protein P4N59_25715 [Negativicutes bacterium]|nr:hypothetical protein [Negativicutes bacterium]